MNNTQNLVSIFVIENLTLSKQNISAKAILNVDSEIFLAHFPGDPITPGVCQLHLIGDILNKAMPHSNAILFQAKQIKFVDMLRPKNISSVLVEINFTQNKNIIDLTATISHEQTIFFKGKLSYCCND